MPIELEDLPPRREFTLRPWGVMVWVALFLLCALVGMAAVTFLWPAGKPTMTLRWWNWLAIYPGCTFAGLCTLYYTVFGALRNKVINWNEDHDDVWDEETVRGQKAIRLYRISYATPLGLGCLAQQLTDKKSALSAVDVDGQGHVICSRYDPEFFMAVDKNTPAKKADAVGETEAEAKRIQALADMWNSTNSGDAARVAASSEKEVTHANKNTSDSKLTPDNVIPKIFGYITRPLLKELRTLPTSRLRVCLAFNEALGALDPVDVWKSACANANLNLPEPELLPDGLMALDRWLDERDAGKPFPLTLVVSVTRFDAPPARGGDAAVAMLLGPDVNDKHLALPPIAWVHRPELLRRVSNPVPLSMEYALRWGGFLPELLDTVWLSGLDQETQVPVLSALRDIGLPPEGHPRVDISAALGNTDVTGGWLALAAAVEHGQGNGKPQYIVAADPKTVALVVDPVQRAAEPVESADLATQAA